MSKQTNGALRFHKGDYQNVKHLSLFRCASGGVGGTSSAEEEAQTKGESVDEGERGER